MVAYTGRKQRLKVDFGIGDDFRGAMVATGPGEKLLIRRRPVRNWTQLRNVHVVHRTFKVLQFLDLCHCHWQSITQQYTDGNAVRCQAGFCAEYYIYSEEKSTETAATRAALFYCNMHQIVCPNPDPRPHLWSLQRSPKVPPNPI